MAYSIVPQGMQGMPFPQMLQPQLQAVAQSPAQPQAVPQVPAGLPSGIVTAPCNTEQRYLPGPVHGVSK